MVLAPVEKIIIYIPVEDATLGGQPKLSNKGLNIEPPPKPKAPDTQPPRNENTRSLIRGPPCSLTSDDAKPFPYFYFRSCSFCTVLRLHTLSNTHRTT